MFGLLTKLFIHVESQANPLLWLCTMYMYVLTVVLIKVNIFLFCSS